MTVRLSVFAAVYLCISLGSTLLALGCCDAPCLPCRGLDYHGTLGPCVILKIVLLCFCSVSGVTKACSFASCLVPLGALCNTVCFEIISFLIYKKKIIIKKKKTIRHCLGICCIFVGYFKLSMSDNISCLHALWLVSDTTPFLLYKVLVILVIKKKKFLSYHLLTVLLPPWSLRPTHILALHLLNCHYHCLYKWSGENDHFK